MKKILPILLLALHAYGYTYAQTFNWASQAGTNLNDAGYAIAVDAAGNSYVTGSFRGTITFPSGPSFTSAGFADIFVAKYAPNGVFLWARQAQGPFDDQGSGISVDGLGNAYVTGFIGGGTVLFAPGKTITSSGASDIFVAKYNSSGTVQWVLQCGGLYSDAGNGIAAQAYSKEGNFYVTGSFSVAAVFKSTSGASVSLTAAGGDDIFVASYDTNGLLRWVRKAGGTQVEAGQSIHVDGQNNAYVTGFFESSFVWGGATLTPLVTDGFLTKYDQWGNVLWVRTMYGPSVDRGRSVSVNSAGDPYVAGTYFTSLKFSGSAINLSSVGTNQEIFVARYNTNGQLLWARSAGGPGSDLVSGISVRGAGGPYLTGLFFSTASFGGFSLTSLGAGDIFVASYSPTGAILWVRRTGGVNHDFGNGIGVDGVGHAYITGGYESSPANFPGTGSLTNSNTTTSNFFVTEIH